MSNLRGFKQKVSTVSRLWEEQDYDYGVSRSRVLAQSLAWECASARPLGKPGATARGSEARLDEAKQALQQAVELDKGSPAAAIELGHFLDNVEDDPQAAAKAYAEGVSIARQLLIDGLIGQAKAFRQLDRREDFLRCLLEVLHLARFEAGPKRPRRKSLGQTSYSSRQRVTSTPSNSTAPYAEQIQDLLSEVVADRSA